MKKLSVGLFCGGESPEHDISLMSAKNILDGLYKNQDVFQVFIIFISKDGHWYHAENLEYLNTPKKARLEPLMIMPGYKKSSVVFKNFPEKALSIDIAFPVLHGPLGEDGSLQGLLKMLGIRFVGNGILSSAINLDKAMTKYILKKENIPVADYLFFREEKPSFEDVKAKLGLPFFLKPNNTGSSIGVSKVENIDTFHQALHEALRYDKNIIVERYVPGREIECSVLGNTEAIVSSAIGEIIVNKATYAFYGYEAKYFDPSGSRVVVPANVPEKIIKTCHDMALGAFKALRCEGLARVDFFYTPDEKVVLNELNTLPGFTNISVYPQCFEKSGISLEALVKKLVFLGLEG